MDLATRPLLHTPGLPRELLYLRRWVVYLHDKRPVLPDMRTPASSTDPTTWSAAMSVLRAIDLAPNDLICGPGIVLGELDDARVLAGIDIDGCRDPESGALDDTATAIIESMDSYTEASPSGTGIHILFFGIVPAGRSRRGPVEMYDSGRYFTTTGVRIVEQNIEHRDRESRLVWQTFVGDPMDRTPAPVAPRQTGLLSMSDLDIIERATTAKNGAKVAALLAGDPSGYRSRSEADAALASCLAFWTDDPDQIERLVRQSGLYRDDKERRNRTYYERTANRAAAFGGTR